MAPHGSFVDHGGGHGGGNAHFGGFGGHAHGGGGHVEQYRSASSSPVDFPHQRPSTAGPNHLVSSQALGATADALKVFVSVVADVFEGVGVQTPRLEDLVDPVALPALAAIWNHPDASRMNARSLTPDFEPRRRQALAMFRERSEAVVMESWKVEQVEHGGGGGGGGGSPRSPRFTEGTSLIPPGRTIDDSRHHIHTGAPWQLDGDGDGGGGSDGGGGGGGGGEGCVGGERRGGGGRATEMRGGEGSEDGRGATFGLTGKRAGAASDDGCDQCRRGNLAERGRALHWIALLYRRRALSASVGLWRSRSTKTTAQRFAVTVAVRTYRVCRAKEVADAWHTWTRAVYGKRGSVVVSRALRSMVRCVRCSILRGGIRRMSQFAQFSTRRAHVLRSVVKRKLRNLLSVAWRRWAGRLSRDAHLTMGVKRLHQVLVAHQRCDECDDGVD